METAFEGQPGVKAVVSGFDGGPEKNVSYEQVSSGSTGHAESVHVFYDPAKTSYAKLLELYWHNIDPFSAEGQFCDRGHQYRAPSSTSTTRRRRRPKSPSAPSKRS